MRLGRLDAVQVWMIALMRRPRASAETSAGDDRQYLFERVDDAAVIQLYVDGFEAIDIREKTLIWHL